jgi:sulfite exporter TauE/SafE
MMDHAAVDLVGFFTLGLLGGFGHCVGMCTPFVLFVSRRSRGAGLPPASLGCLGPARRATPGGQRMAAITAQGWYTTGRVLTYALLGALAGALGSAVALAGRLVGLRRGAMVIAGAALVLWALAELGNLAPPVASTSVFTRIAASLSRRVPGHPLAIGLFLGLLPCGFLYSALVAAVSQGGALRGAAALALFGLGTAPALLGVSLADEFLARRRQFLNRLAQAFILAMGGWFLWRGLSG